MSLRGFAYTMKERVDLNNNGLSIESTARVLQDNKWVHRHILCKKQPDLSAPLLMIFKNKREKQHNIAKSSIVLQEYVGFESGFEHKRRRNTLCIIAASTTIILAFDLAESLVIWETWLRNTCGHALAFFMQMKRVPNYQKYQGAVMKEVRCHVHDSRIAIVYGRPQECLYFSHLNDCVVEVDDHNLIAIVPNENEPREAFILLCGKSQSFKVCVEAAKTNGALHKLVSRQQLEGDWMPKEQKKSIDATSQLTVNVSELASMMRTPEPTHTIKVENPTYTMLNREKSKSGFVINSQPHHHRPISRANSTAAYYSTIGDIAHRIRASSGNISGNYVNISGANSTLLIETPPPPPLPHVIQIPDVPNYYNFGHSIPENTIYEVIGAQATRSTSLPDYVNVLLTNELHLNHHPIRDDPPRAATSHADRLRRRSDNSMKDYSMHPSTSKGRSIPDFSSHPYETETRHENWRRAKKFFSAFKPKSQSDLHHKKSLISNHSSITKACSTGALQFADTVSFFPRRSTDSMSDNEDKPPPLNINVSESTLNSQSQANLENERPPHAGLVRARDDITIKAKSGVPAILARRLAASIRGSFTKYDGERSTHMYQPHPPPPPLPPLDPNQPPPRPPKSSKFDGISAAVNRGQEKLKQSDRRASSVSFHKVNAVPGPYSPPHMSPQSGHRPSPPPPTGPIDYFSTAEIMPDPVPATGPIDYYSREIATSPPPVSREPSGSFLKGTPKKTPKEPPSYFAKANFLSRISLSKALKEPPSYAIRDAPSYFSRVEILHKEKEKPGIEEPPVEGNNITRVIVLPVMCSPRYSSQSEATRSSQESLSSDARSRISVIRKRNNSPPRMAAPILIRHPVPMPIIVKAEVHATSSVDSLNSEQTTRSASPVRLPTRMHKLTNSSNSIQSAGSRRTVNVDYCDLLPSRTGAAASSSSSTSINSRSGVEYVLIDPITTTAAKEASSMMQNPFERTRIKSSSMTGMPVMRRRSQGQGSSNSDSQSMGQPAKQGFFKKYRKMRRNKKNASSMSQLNF